MIKFDHNIDRFERKLSAVERRQLPFATAMALNDTAKDALHRTRDEAERSFENPTPFTKNAFYAVRATKREPMATIRRKTRQSGRHHLEVQSEGGTRSQTGLEKLLASRLKYAGIIQTVTPGPAAELDRYGNLRRGMMNRVIDSLARQGPRRPTKRGGIGGVDRRRQDYFIKGKGRTFGVYKRQVSTGDVIGKVLNFSSKRPTYRKMYHFNRAMAEAARKNFARHFERRMREAIATAK